jgi:hypothetical protein
MEELLVVPGLRSLDCQREFESSILPPTVLIIIITIIINLVLVTLTDDSLTFTIYLGCLLCALWFQQCQSKRLENVACKQVGSIA